MNESDTSQDSAPTYVYLAGLMAYGWSLEGLLNSHTKLMRALNPTICCAIQAFSTRTAFDLLVHWGSPLCFHCSEYLRKRRLDGGSGDFDSQDKRRRVDGPGTSERFSPGRSDSDPATTSHLIPPSTSSHEECNERDLSDLSQLNTLAFAAAQARLFEDPLSPNPAYSQQPFIYARSSSSTVQDMVNYSGMAAMSPLHLWHGDDMADRACEELLYMDPFHLNLWAAQDLPIGPFEILQSDFDLVDGQTL